MKLLLVALEIANQTMKQFPNYNQRKRRDYYSKVERLRREWSKPYADRDDDLILNLKDELQIFLEAFYKEIKQ